jgi:hypothetical protein
MIVNYLFILTHLAVDQEVKYSEDYQQLIDNFDTASDVTIEFGSISSLQEGVNDFIFVSAQYTSGKNIYLAVRVTGANGEEVLFK